MFLTLNHAGDSENNPILAGLRQTITYHKSSESEVLKRCWITGSGHRKELTASCVENTNTITVDILHGTNSFSGGDPVENTIHITTDKCHFYGTFYVMNQPNNMIELDGYNANDSDEPLVVPLYPGA